MRKRRSHFRRSLAELESDLETTRVRIQQLENTLRGVVRNLDNISIGGPCRCGESMLLIRQKKIFCPECGYQRTM
uniref:Uncharacterized protein n=2 Tax=Natrinema halophilum TaxID=1699371 RepID=A0A7D5KU14_9EURY